MPQITAAVTNDVKQIKKHRGAANPEHYGERIHTHCEFLNYVDVRQTVIPETFIVIYMTDEVGETKCIKDNDEKYIEQVERKPDDLARPKELFYGQNRSDEHQKIYVGNDLYPNVSVYTGGCGLAAMKKTKTEEYCQYKQYT